MGLEHIDGLKPEDQEFVQRAIEATNNGGDKSVLLLVGSHAAGHAVSGSDLDLWIIGDKRCLPQAQQQEHDLRGGVFVDRGDLQAHWHFYDEEYLAGRLADWPSEMMWILATAKCIHGRKATLEELQARYAGFPRPVAQKKLKWLVGYYRSLLGPISRAAATGRTTGAFSLVGQAIDAICKICCVAQCRPWPYHKWLTDVARTTSLGQALMPYADRCVDAFLHAPRSVHGQPWADWPVRKELNGILEALPAELKKLGWLGDWVDDPWEAVDETFKRSLP
jgi:hypothetical protein